MTTQTHVAGGGQEPTPTIPPTPPRPRAGGSPWPDPPPPLPQPSGPTGPRGTVYGSRAADRAVGRRRWRTFGAVAYVMAAAYAVAVLAGWL